MASIAYRSACDTINKNEIVTFGLAYLGLAHVLGGISPLAGFTVGVISTIINNNLPTSEGKSKLEKIQFLAMQALSALGGAFLASVICPVIGIPLTFTAALLFSLKTNIIILGIAFCYIELGFHGIARKAY